VKQDLKKWIGKKKEQHRALVKKTGYVCVT